MITPMLANGFVTIEIEMNWFLALVGAGIFAAPVALVIGLEPSFVGRHRTLARCCAFLSLAVSLVPFAVPLLYRGELSFFLNSREFVKEIAVLSCLSLVPLVASGLAVYFSMRAPRQGPKP